jgi:site-specific recombinase XerD
MVKAVIRNSDVSMRGKVNIKLRITHNRKALYLSTNYHIEPLNFDNKKGIVKDTYPNSASLNIQLKILILKAEQRIIELGDKLHKMDIHSLKEYIKDVKKKSDVFEMFEKVISDKKQIGRLHSASNYQLALNKLKEFHPYNELTFQSIDYSFLDEFQTWLLSKKLKVNYISILLRSIRSVFNKAINNNLIGFDVYPFRRFKIRSEQTRKRNLPAGIISQISRLELKGSVEVARDMFMLSFYLIGMNVPDMFNLKKTDLLGDRIKYRRQKTGKIVSVKVFPPAQVIIDKYKSKTKHLLNLKEKYVDYQGFAKRANVDLKTVADTIGLVERISFYYARHSWSTIGVSIGINQDVIGKALSHSSHTVTDVYTEYNPALIDDANRKIVEYVLQHI